MRTPELRLFRRDGREFRARESEPGYLIISEWAADPGEEWRMVSEFALSSRELERLAAWQWDSLDVPGLTSDRDAGDDTDQEERSAAPSDRSELDDAIAQGVAKRVNPTEPDSPHSLPHPKARGAFKRPPV